MTISLAGLKKAEPKSKKKEKPLLPDPTGALAELVTQGIKADQEKKAWESSGKEVNSQLAAAAVGHIFDTYHGHQGEIEDSFKVRAVGGSVMVSIKNAYKLPENLTGVRKLLGDHTDTYLHKSFVVKVDSDAIPASMQQYFIDELVALAKRLDEDHALATLSEVPESGGPIINAISVVEEVTVDKAFHADRHSLFTPEQNRAIQAVMPFQVACRYEY